MKNPKGDLPGASHFESPSLLLRPVIFEALDLTIWKLFQPLGVPFGGQYIKRSPIFQAPKNREVVGDDFLFGASLKANLRVAFRLLKGVTIRRPSPFALFA